MKRVRIRSYFGPHFPAFELNTERYSVSLCIQSECVYSVRMRENADQNNSKYGHLFYLFDLYLKLTKTSRIHIAWHLHKNIATQNIINEC